MKWLLRELAVLGITVFLIMPMTLVIFLCLPFFAVWSLCVDDDGLEGIDGSTDV
jgi:hypothetical protein